MSYIGVSVFGLATMVLPLFEFFVEFFNFSFSLKENLIKIHQMTGSGRDDSITTQLNDHNLVTI